MVSTSDILAAKVLVVDDQEANVTLLVRMLHGAGYTRVESTMDPLEVCALHRERHFDLVVLDLQMPGMDGFEVMEGLKELEVDGYLSVLAVTAQPAHELRALQAGAKDFVSKPIALPQVLMRVHNLLEVRLLHDEARRNAKMLESLALEDPLTGLANRRLLAERMRIAIAHGRMNETAMAVACVDLDGFKQVNDELGHGAGDAVLKEVAGRLLAAVRAEDTIARLGGDEFMIALWHVASAEDAALVAAKVIEALARPYAIEGAVASLTASVGVSLYPTHGEDAKTLMERADLALYEAKRAGKNTFRIAQGAGPSPAARAHGERRGTGTPDDARGKPGN